MPARLFLPRLAYVPSSGFTPPVKASLAYWFDASTISGSDGDLLSQWNDLSGNGNHATKGAGSNSNRPVLKRNIVNGRSVVRFNLGGGTTNYFDLPSAMGAATSGELFIVAKADADPAASTTTGVGMITLPGSGISGDSAWPFNDGKIYETFGSNAADHTAISKTPNLASAFSLYHVVAEDKHYPVRINGDFYHLASVNTVNFNNTHRHIANTLSDGVSAGPWRGDIAEILIYKASLTDTQRQLVYTYLANKYGITVTPTTAITPATYAGLQMWYKADVLGLNDGDPVSTWADQSGNARDITAAGAARPTFKSTGLNSRNSVRFTTAQSLSLASAFSIAAGGAFTLLAVGQYTADCSIIGHPTDNNQIRVRRGGINQISSFINSGSEAISNTFSRVVGDPFYGTWRRNTSNQHSPVLSDGDLNSSATVTTANTWRMATLGGGSVGINLAGDISEFCLYNSFLTTQQMWNLYEYYFRSKWGLP